MGATESKYEKEALKQQQGGEARQAEKRHNLSWWLEASP